MRRIKAACLQQTVHFQVKEEWKPELAAQAVREEYEHYKKQLERSRTKYQIVEEQPQADGSLMIKIRKQYNSHSWGDYMD